MKSIACGALKGGAGKTMFAVNLAGCLAEKSRVLLIDTDPQSNASSGVGADITALGSLGATRATVADIFDGSITPEELVMRSIIPDLPNLDLIPSSIFMAKTESRLSGRSGRESILLHYIEDNRDFFNHYDYLIFDTAPSMSIISQNAFLAADEIVLITDVSMNGIIGIEMFAALWDEIRDALRKEDNLHTFVINNYDKRIKLANELLEYCTKNTDLKDAVVLPVIDARVAMKDTEMDHLPINLIHKNSESHKTFISIIKELKKRGVL